MGPDTRCCVLQLSAHGRHAFCNVVLQLARCPSAHATRLAPCIRPRPCRNIGDPILEWHPAGLAHPRRVFASGAAGVCLAGA